MIKIDKSLFSAEELEQYEALIAKATVDPEAAEEEMEDDKPETPPKKKPTEKAEVEDMDKSKCKKSVEETAPELAPEIKKALEEVAELKKSMELKEMRQIAKKYAPLGKEEDELAQTLYDMKKSNPANYDAYVSVLDEHLALVEKSGMFAEIGKSASGETSGNVLDKIEAAANEIQKSDASLSRVEAVAKAWENHPELMAEYDQEYSR